MAAIRAACPKAVISTKVSETYPVQVSVSYGESILWKGPQRRLFRKYAEERNKAMAEITAAVKAALTK